MNITLRDVYRTSTDGGVLYTKKHRTFSSLLCMRFLFFGRTCVCAYPQMKCLPVPDMLSDAVKEEQVRTREAGRSSRGAGAGARACSYGGSGSSRKRPCYDTSHTPTRRKGTRQAAKIASFPPHTSLSPDRPTDDQPRLTTITTSPTHDQSHQSITLSTFFLKNARLSISTIGYHLVQIKKESSSRWNTPNTSSFWRRPRTLSTFVIWHTK
ncbi:hypothetical protein F5141DRAFT_1099131 [Pisolithus sp. B1]|nr:hypothetical protein F5141DRAFT_1099131 [Pisolithus sp. B1]